MPSDYLTLIPTSCVAGDCRGTCWLLCRREYGTTDVCVSHVGWREYDIEKGYAYLHTILAFIFWPASITNMPREKKNTYENRPLYSSFIFPPCFSFIASCIEFPCHLEALFFISCALCSSLLYITFFFSLFFTYFGLAPVMVVSQIRLFFFLNPSKGR